MKENHNEYVLIREIELNLNGAPVITQSTTEKAEAVAWYYGRALVNAERDELRSRSNRMIARAVHCTGSTS